jgi:hypothetical protein
MFSEELDSSDGRSAQRLSACLMALWRDVLLPFGGGGCGGVYQ